MDSPAARRFHRSLYLSLALACVTLGYAEWLFLPDTLAFAIPVTLSLLAAYRIEGRWSLTLQAANFVGAMIVVVVLAWAGYQLMRPGDTILQHLLGPTKLLPLLGPLVLVIIPA